MYLVFIKIKYSAGHHHGVTGINFLLHTIRLVAPKMAIKTSKLYIACIKRLFYTG
jgi:hypothetical protein